jgi:hypothetical protein
LALAHDVAAAKQGFDDRCARCWCAETRVPHRGAQRFVVDRFACGLHRAEQRGFRVARGWGGLFCGVGKTTVETLALDERRQDRGRVAIVLVARTARIPRVPRIVAWVAWFDARDRLPAGDGADTAAGEIAVRHRRQGIEHRISIDM